MCNSHSYLAGRSRSWTRHLGEMQQDLLFFQTSEVLDAFSRQVHGRQGSVASVRRSPATSVVGLVAACFARASPKDSNCTAQAPERPKRSAPFQSLPWTPATRMPGPGSGPEEPRAVWHTPREGPAPPAARRGKPPPRRHLPGRVRAGRSAPPLP